MPSQKTGVKKIINGDMLSEMIDFIKICECVQSCKFYPKLCLAFGFTVTKSIGTVTVQDAQLNVTSVCPYPTVEVIISFQQYPENYRK